MGEVGGGVALGCLLMLKSLLLLPEHVRDPVRIVSKMLELGGVYRRNTGGDLDDDDVVDVIDVTVVVDASDS